MGRSVLSKIISFACLASLLDHSIDLTREREIQTETIGLLGQIHEQRIKNESSYFMKNIRSAFLKNEQNRRMLFDAFQSLSVTCVSSCGELICNYWDLLLAGLLCFSLSHAMMCCKSYKRGIKGWKRRNGAVVRARELAWVLRKKWRHLAASGLRVSENDSELHDVCFKGSKSQSSSWFSHDISS